MLDDVKRWDEVHKKAVNEIAKHSFYAEKCEKLFPRGSLVCDLGGGLGFDAMYFIKNGHRVILLDISTFALKQARNLTKENKCTEKLLTKQVDFGLGKIPLKDSSLDVAFSRIGLNYFPYKETRTLLSEIYRTLKPKASAYLTLKSPDDLEEMNFIKDVAVEMEPGVFIEGEQIRSRFSVDQLTQMLKEVSINNFKILPFREEADAARDEFGVSKEKPLSLNEIIFTKD